MPTMRDPSELVVDSSAFSLLSAQSTSIFKPAKRLPDFVFQRQFRRYFAVEHAHTYGEKFGSFLFKLSQIFGDQSINYMTLEPDPVAYYHRNFQFFGLASFNPSSVMKRYVPVMSRNGHTDSFRARGGDVGEFW